jgi:hypothetical protein
MFAQLGGMPPALALRTRRSVIFGAKGYSVIRARVRHVHGRVIVQWVVE